MRSVDELIALAVTGDEDDQRAWEAIGELRERGGDAVFEAARRLTQSSSAKERGRGVDILAQLGTPSPNAELRVKCGDVILERIASEQTPAVLNSMGVALGHLRDARAVDALAPLASHPDAGVRCGVVLGLLWHVSAMTRLIELSSDADDDVRNWATFGLGQLNADTPALRDALVARLSDENFETRGEALAGLAQRGDPRVREPLRRELAAPRVGVLAIEAAGLLGDRSLLPLLLELSRNGKTRTRTSGASSTRRSRHCRADRRARDYEEPMRVFITGSADGLGKLAAKTLLAAGHEVIVHVRAKSRLDAVKDLHTKVVIGDLADPAQTRDLAAQVNALGTMDSVIHNAGVYQSGAVMQVNVLAPYVLTALMHRPKRLVYLSSGLHRGGRPNLDGLVSGSYSDSKLFISTFAAALARRWPEVLINSVDPGWVPTKMGGRSAPDDLRLGHLTQEWLATSDDPKALTSGGSWHHQQRVEPHASVSDVTFQNELLDALANATGTKLP